MDDKDKKIPESIQWITESDLEESDFATIVHVPMLTDPTVNPAIIPGVCKILERFYLTYKIKDVINLINTRYRSGLPGTMRLKGNKIVTEQVSPEKQAEFDKRAREFEKNIAQQNTLPLNPTQRSAMSEPYYGSDEYKEKDKNDVKSHPILKGDIKGPSPQQITLEPTYITVGTGHDVRMIGIKVIPYTLRGNVTLAQSLTRESNFGFLQSKLVQISRGIIRNVSKLLKKRWFWPFKGTLTGDVKRDILWGGSEERGTFLLVNARDLQNMSFEELNIQRLADMNWGSFVIADDIMKNVKFCMTEFKGLCSVIPYSFLYGIVGSEAMKAYEDLSDVKKSISPMFSLKGRTKNLFGRR